MDSWTYACAYAFNVKVVNTIDSSFDAEFKVALHFLNAGSSGKSSITVMSNSEWSDPSSFKYFLTHSMRRTNQKNNFSD